MTVRATPEIRAKVLADKKSGKLSGATALAKAHNISRSAVYRILAGEKNEKPLNEPKEPKEQKGKREQTVSKDDESEGEDSGSEDRPSNDFFYRNVKFAEDMGLAESTHRSAFDEPGQKPDDDEMDGLMDAITGSGAVRPEPAFIDDIFRMPPPRQARFTETPSNERPPTVVRLYDREDLTQRIIFNVQHFGPLLETITGPKDTFIQSLGKKDGAELKHLLTTLERTRSVGTLSAGFKQVFYVAAQGVEFASGMIGVESQGFTSHLKEQDEEITMCLKEIALNEWERLKTLDSPQMRLGVLFALTLAQTHTRNAMASQIAHANAVPVNPEVAKANEDL